MMKAYALIADENGRIQHAAAAYEAALRMNPADPESIVNLTVLYWRAAGHPLSLPGPLSGEFRLCARRRVPELLDLATRWFADRADVRFWEKYIAAADAGRALESSECRQLMEVRPDYLEPAFVVFCNSAGQDAEPEAMRLLADCSEHPTTRGRYVTSIINGVLTGQRWCHRSVRLRCVLA
jgi:hypothetical protein